MPQAFLASNPDNTSIQATVKTKPTSEPSRERVKLLVIGSSHVVERVVLELHRVGFAEIREWSKPLPTGNYGEIMRILSRYVIVEW